MSAIQNVRVAFTNGMLAVLAGIIPVVICLVFMPILANKNER
jgi:type II secretory pathway component PulF